ncbi:transmembrane protein 9 isoform X1 [Sus scrofa]|uniref:Transmembrane protein 9 isoform X1 n=1 Tax=Sus scrofa TaxID=9823 RepID=A0A481DMT3_PIG|nr:transmembrane protein 9 isoform X1 [Sus scrofa]
MAPGGISWCLDQASSFLVCRLYAARELMVPVPGWGRGCVPGGRGSPPSRAVNAQGTGWRCPPWRSCCACGLLAQPLAVDSRPGEEPSGVGLQGSLRLFRTQIIIVIYLSVVGALLLYMAFLMLVDPLIRKPDAYTERLHNEEENEDARSVAAAASFGPRANTVLERVEGAQQRWKLQVQEQRKTVFDRHKMLS